LGRLNKRLLLVVSVAMAPAIGLQAYACMHARHGRQHLAEAEALRLVSFLTIDGQRIAEDARQALDGVASVTSVQDGDAEDCQRTLASLPRMAPRFIAATATGLDGQAICGPAPPAGAPVLPDRAGSSTTTPAGGFVIGGYEEGWLRLQPALLMAEPFRDRAGRVAGLLLLALSAEWLESEIERMPWPPGAEAAIMDRTGTVVAYHPGGGHHAGGHAPPDALDGIRGDVPGTGTMRGIDGAERLVAYKPLGAPPEGLLIAVGLVRTRPPRVRSGLAGRGWH
jgi:hypothetical protein